MTIDLDRQRPTGLDPVSNSSHEGGANRPAMYSKAHRVVVRCGATTFVIVACIGLVVAAHVGRRGGESTDASAMEETTGSIGDSQRATAELALSEEERGRLYEGIMRIADAWVANLPAPAVADALPSDVPLHDLPAGMAQEIPQVEGHSVAFHLRNLLRHAGGQIVQRHFARQRVGD